MKWNKIHYTHLLTILIQVYGMKSKSENDISNLKKKKRLCDQFITTCSRLI